MDRDPPLAAVHHAPPDGAPRSSARAGERALEVVCVVLIALLLLEILSFDYGRDQGIYAMVARAVVAGRMPYRDAWDFKPPGIFVVYAVSRALFGARMVGIRIVEVAGLAGMVAAMVRLTEAWWGERLVGFMAGAIAVLVHAQLEFWHTAQPESFGGMVTIFALALLGPMMGSDAPLRVEARETARRLLLAGALFGFAGLLKPPLAGGGAVLAAALGLRILRERPAGSHHRLRAAFRPAALVVVGGALPFALCLLWFAARGALPALRDVLFVFTPHYTRISWVGETLSGMLYAGFDDWLSTYSSVTTVGFLLCLAFPRAGRERFGVGVIGAIIAVHLVGVVMQGKFFPYHYGATWPLTALLAALGFHRVWERLAPLGAAGAAVLLAGIVFVAFGRTATPDLHPSFLQRTLQRVEIFTHAPRDQAALDRLASVADVNAGANREVGEFLKAHVPADRTVFVWGFEPVIYDLAERAPASRYLYDVPQRVAWAQDKEREILMGDLFVGRPAAIVVEHRDVFPVVTGDAVDSADRLRDFAGLSWLIATRYALATTIEDFDVYLEKP